MKPGWKTSEFWFGLVGIILTYCNEKLDLHLPVSAIISILGVVASYIWGRSVVKAANAKASK